MLIVLTLSSANFAMISMDHHQPTTGKSMLTVSSAMLDKLSVDHHQHKINTYVDSVVCYVRQDFYGPSSTYNQQTIRILMLTVSSAVLDKISMDRHSVFNSHR